MGPSMTDAPIRVLVVDDDPLITKTYDEILRGQQYEVIIASTCAIAKAEMARVQGDVRVMIVDFGLPDCDGGDLVRDLVRLYGARPILYVSGWTDEFWQLPEVSARWLMMRKPVPIRRLLAAIRWLALGGDKPAELDQPG
jgi:DNA-binding response OmpR family regulator